MTNRRPNSCPVDPWKHDSEFSDDRPKSVMRGQDKDDSRKNEPIVGADVTAKPSQSLSRTKVNKWVDSKSKDKEKTDSNPSGDSKLFQHLPQRRVTSPAVAPEISGITRPQTEPGRARTPMFSDDVKNLGRQGFSDVANSPAVTENQEPEEDWVMVEKSTSDTVMPFDPDDESNVLVPSPSRINEILENERLDRMERTKMAFSNKFGSAFKVLPEAREKLMAETRGPSSGLGETDGESTVPKSKSGKPSMAHIMTFATSISKFKRRLADQPKIGFATLDLDHRQLLQAESDNMKTEIPQAMLRTIREEAYRIVVKTTQTYRSQIGSKHRLTKEACEYLKDLREELQKK